MTMKTRKMNNYSLLHVSTVVALTIALVTSTFAFPMGTSTSKAQLSYANPYVPNNPGPENGTMNVSVYAYLNWTGGDPDGDPVTYDIYFGTMSPPPKLVANQSITYYDPYDYAGAMNYSTVYYWFIIAWDNESNSALGPQWQFTTKANDPPNTPSNPYPEHNSTDIPATAALNWTGGDPDGEQVPVTYDVYFGPTSPPEKVVSNQSGTTYDPAGTMNYTTLYYWMIVAWDDQNTSAVGPQWEFTTGVKPNLPPNAPSNPSPTNGQTGVSLTPTLSWTGGDPEGDTVTYTVFFGTASIPPVATENQSGTTFNPGSLNYGTKYYWKIIAWDNHSQSTPGQTWSFTTIQGTSISVEITKPIENKLYVQDTERINLMANTIVYGPITITANVTSTLGVAYVLFIIDGKVVLNDTEAPYEYLWKPLIQFNGMSLKHTIKVVAYNTLGYNASDEINVTKWRFHPLPWIVAGIAIAASLVIHTKITGWIYNLQESRFSCSFYVFSAFYKTTGPFRKARGVIKMKAVTGGKIIGPTSLTKIGLFHKLAFGSFTFIGVPHYTSRGGLLGNFLSSRQSSDSGLLRNLLTR